MLPPETTKASDLLLSAHRQRPIVAVTPYCDTSQCAFPTPEGPFIKLYRLPNKAISNKNRALRTANWLCIHADCIIRVVPRAKLDGLNLGLVPGCCILCCHKLPGATLIFVLPSSYQAMRGNYQSGTSKMGSNLAEEHFRSMVRVPRAGPFKVPSYPTSCFSLSPWESAWKCFEPSLVGSALGIAVLPIFQSLLAPPLGTVAVTVTKFNAW
jgi:hypothetical protein